MLLRGLLGAPGGIIHRDLEPAKVMVDREERLGVDFGPARRDSRASAEMSEVTT